jgi:hypothetical protein
VAELKGFLTMYIDIMQAPKSRSLPLWAGGFTAVCMSTKACASSPCDWVRVAGGITGLCWKDVFSLNYQSRVHVLFRIEVVVSKGLSCIFDASKMLYTIGHVIVQGFDGPSSLAEDGIDQEQKNTDLSSFISFVRQLDPLVACLLL